MMKVLNSLVAMVPESTSSLTTSPGWSVTRLVEEQPQPGLASQPDI